MEGLGQAAAAAAAAAAAYLGRETPCARLYGVVNTLSWGYYYGPPCGNPGSGFSPLVHPVSEGLLRVDSIAGCCGRKGRSDVLSAPGFALDRVTDGFRRPRASDRPLSASAAIGF
jgi:hypothetical protein